MKNFRKQKRSGFEPFWSENGYSFSPLWSQIGLGFQGNHKGEHILAGINVRFQILLNSDFKKCLNNVLSLFGQGDRFTNRL